MLPCAAIQALNERLEGSDRLCRREAAVVGPVHEELTSQAAVARRLDHAGVGLLVLQRHQAVARRVEGQDGELDLPVEDDVLAQVGDGAGVGRDARRILQGWRSASRLSSA